MLTQEPHQVPISLGWVSTNSKYVHKKLQKQQKWGRHMHCEAASSKQGHCLWLTTEVADSNNSITKSQGSRSRSYRKQRTIPILTRIAAACLLEKQSAQITYLGLTCLLLLMTCSAIFVAVQLYHVSICGIRIISSKELQQDTTTLNEPVQAFTWSLFVTSILAATSMTLLPSAHPSSTISAMGFTYSYAHTIQK